MGGNQAKQIEDKVISVFKEQDEKIRCLKS